MSGMEESESSAGADGPPSGGEIPQKGDGADLFNHVVDPTRETGLARRVEIGRKLHAVRIAVGATMNDHHPSLHHLAEGFAAVVSLYAQRDPLAQVKRLFAVKVKAAEADVADRHRDRRLFGGDLRRSGKWNTDIFSSLHHGQSIAYPRGERQTDVNRRI